MKSIGPIALPVMFGLTAANYIYQALANDPSWITASERSFFQCVAILAVWFGTAFLNRVHD